MINDCGCNSTRHQREVIFFFFLFLFFVFLSSTDCGKKGERPDRMDGHLLFLASFSPNRLSILLSRHQGYITPFET